MRNGQYTFASPVTQTLCERGFTLATRIAALTPMGQVAPKYRERSTAVHDDLQLQLLQTTIALLEEHRALMPSESDRCRCDATLAELLERLLIAGGRRLEHAA